MANASLPPKPTDPPYSWYQRGNKPMKYPIPPESENSANHHFREGWERAIEGDNPLLRSTDKDPNRYALMYFEGYAKGVHWALENGFVDEFRAQEQLSFVPIAFPAASKLSVVVPLMPKTVQWNEGYADAINLRPPKIHKFEADQHEYDEGFHSGVEWVLDDGRISANEARKLLGLPDVTNEDPEDTAPTNVEPEMVNHPAHYNFGEHEVVEVLHDWQLPYPLDDVVKYIARAGKKDPAKELQDLEKARFYLNFRVAKLGGDDWNPKHAK